MRQSARAVEPPSKIRRVEARLYRAIRPLHPDMHSLSLPIRALSGVAKHRASPALDPSSRTVTDAPGRPLRVLVVEDEAIIAMEIEMILEDLGAEIVGRAMTATEAEHLAHLHRPDFVTMDINIKGDRDGVSAATEIYETLGIRSIFVSAYGNAETRTRAGAAHPIGWIQKPFTTEDFRRALERVADED